MATAVGPHLDLAERESDLVRVGAGGNPAAAGEPSPSATGDARPCAEAAQVDHDPEDQDQDEQLSDTEAPHQGLLPRTFEPSVRHCPEGARSCPGEDAPLGPFGPFAAAGFATP
jgi:hypothetical protein